MAKNYLEEEEEKRREQEAKKAEQEAKKAEQEAKKAEQTANRQTLTVDEFKKLMKNGQVDQIGFNTDTQQTAQNTQTTTQTDAQKNAQTNTQQAVQTETKRQTLTVDEFKKLMKNGQVDQIGFNTDTQQTAQDAQSTQTAEATEEEKKKQGRKDALKQIYEGSYSDVRVKTNMADDRVKKDILNGEAELDKVDLKSLSDYYKTGKNSDFPGSRTLKKDAKDAEKMHTYKDSMPATTDDKIADVEDQINRVYASKKADREEYEDQDIDDDVAQYDSLVNEEDTDKLKEKLKAAQERADIMDSIKEDDDKISALKKQEKLLKRQKEYEGYIQSDDFEEKSKYDKSRADTSTWSGINGESGSIYYVINTKNRLKGKSEDKMTKKEKEEWDKAAALGDSNSILTDTAVEEMSDDEVKLYNYIYNTKGEKKAAQYLDEIAEGLNYQSAQKTAKKDKGKTAKEIAYGLVSGIDQFGQGMQSIVNGIVSGEDSDEALATSRIQMLGSMYREDLKDKGPKILGSSLGQAGYDMLNTSANMVPSIVVSTVTANPALGAATLGTSVTGNTFNEAWKEGVSKSQAAAYGITSGLAEAGMQYVLGGISKLGGKEGESIVLNGVNKVTGGKVAAVTSKIDAAISNVMKSDAMKVAYGTGKNVTKSMFAEGREEYLQDALDPIFRNITMGENNDSLSAFVSQDSLYSGLLGAVSGGMFEGTNAHAEAKNAQVYKGIGQSMSEEQKTGLVDYAKKAREDLAEFTDLYDTDTTDINAGKLKIAAEKHIGDGIYNADTIEDAQNQLKTVLEENGDNAFVQQTAVEAYMDFAQSKMIDEAQNSQTQTDVTKDTDTDQAADPLTDNSTDMNVSGDEMVNGPEVQNMESPIFDNADENKMTPEMVQEIVKQDHTQTDYNDTIKRVEAGYVNNIKRIAQTMDEDTAKVYVDNYNPKIDPKAYQTVFEQARKAAINEVPYENIQDVVKNKDQFQIMRQMVGEDKVQQFYMAGQKELDKITKDTMSNEERFVANTFAQALGKKIRYVDSIRNGIYGANGKYQDGNIYISLKATNKARVVAAHEATHMMKVEAAAEYKAYEDYVIQNLKDSSAYEDMIKEYQDRIGSKDLDLLHEEIVADSTETFLSDPDKFVEFAKKDTPAARKLIEVVTKLIDKLKETVKKLTPNGKAAKLLQEDIDTYEEAKDLWYQGIESIMEKNAKEDAKKEDVQNTTDRFSMKDEEKDNIFQKDTLSKSEWAMFYSKIGEKKSRYYFPKAADGNDIMTINNKLVYTNGNWERPRIDRVIEIDVDGVSGIERSTYISYIQEELIEYEKNGQEVFEDILEHGKARMEALCGGQVDIKEYYASNSRASSRKRAGRSVQLYDENNKISRNKAGRATADRISESERSGDLKEKFSLKEPVEETKDLIAVHNISEENLMKTIELGGFPMPSIAIEKYNQAHTNFGDISVVFYKDTIDPKQRKENKVYSNDAWTPTFPDVEYSVNEKEISKLAKRLHASEQMLEGNFFNADKEDAVRKLKRNRIAKEAFLEEKGIQAEPVITVPKMNIAENDRVKEFLARNDVTFDKVLNDSTYQKEYLEVLDEEDRDEQKEKLESAKKSHFKYKLRKGSFERNQKVAKEEAEPKVDHDKGIDNAIQEHQKEFDAYVEEIVGPVFGNPGLRNSKDTYTRSGNARTWKQLHYDYNLENIVRVMKEQDSVGAGRTYQVYGNFQGVSSKKYSQLKDIKADSQRIKSLSTEEEKRIKEDFHSRFDEMVRALAKDSKNQYDAELSAGNAIVEAVRNAKTKSGLLRELKKYNPSADTLLVDDISNLVQDLQMAPVKYFEAKPERAVDFSEVAAVVMPDNTDSKVKAAIEKSGMSIEEYRAGDQESRKAAVNKLDGVRFSIKDFDNPEYYTYDNLISLPDMQIENSKMDIVSKDTSRADIRERAFENIQNSKYGRRDGNKCFIKNKYLGDVMITKDSIRHIIVKINENRMIAALNIAKYLPESIVINQTDGARKGANKSYVLLGMMEDGTNQYILRTVLNSYENEYEVSDANVVYSVASKKNQPAYFSQGLGNKSMPSTGSHALSIKDFLKIVKNYFPNELSKDIHEHFETNRKKSEIEGLRYSLKDEEGTSLYNSKEDDFAWMEDILKEEPGIKETASILQEGTEALQKAKKAPDSAAVRKISKSILEDIGSQYDLDTFSDNLEKVFSYMQSEDNVSYDDMVRVMTEVALPAVDAIGNVDKTQQARYDRFKRNVLDTPISLSESQREEVANAEGSVKNWIDQNREHIKIRNDGADLDSGAWHELVVASGYELPAQVNESEMPLVLSEYMEGLKPTVEYYDVDGATRENMAYDTALNIFKKYYGEYAANQKVQNALDHKVADYKKKVRKEIAESYRKEYNATLREKKDTIDFLTGKLSDLTYDIQQARREKDPVKEQDLQEEIDSLKQKLADTKAMNMERIARIKAKNRSSRLQQSYRRKETEYRNKIRKVWNDLQKKATRPTETSYVPADLVKSVLDVCTAVDVVGNNSVMAQKMARLRNVYETLEPKTDHAKVTDELYDANLYEQIKELQSNFQNKRLSDLSYNDLKKVYETMNAIKKQVIQSTQLIGKKKDADAYKKASKEIEIIKNVQRDTVTEKAIDKALHGLTSFGASPLKFKSEMKRISGYTEGSVLVELADDFNKGTVDAKKIEMETENIFNSVLEKEDEVNKTIGKKEEDWVDFMGKVDKNGNPIRIPRSMLLSLAMQVENRSNLKHIIWGGVRIPDAKRYIKGKKDALERGQVIRFGTSGQFNLTKMKRQQIEDICERQIREYLNKNLTSYEKEFLEKSRQFFWKYSGKRINEVSNQLKGYDIARVKHYFPIVTDKNFTKTDVSGLIQNGTLEGMGILKERVSASNPIILESIFDTIERHENNVAKYVGYAIPVRNFNKIYNTTLVGYHDSISNELGKKFGTEAKTYIERFLTDIQSKRDGGPSTLYDKLRGNYAQGILTGNVSVMIKQAASFPTAAYVLGWDNLLKALPQFATNKAFKTDYELIGKYSGLLWDRTQGAFNSELMDIKKNAPKLKIPYLTDWFLNGIEKIDQRTVGSLWYAAESKVQKENSHLKKGTELYYQKVAEVFNEAVLQTQPMYETTQLSDASRNPNKFWKMLFMFKTQPMQNFNILYDSTAEYKAKQKQYKKGNITKEELQKSARNFRAAMSSQVVSAVTFSLMSLAAGSVLNRLNPYKDDDGKMTPDSVIRQLVSDVFSSVAGSFVYGSEVYNFFKSAITGDTYYGTEISSTETLSNMASGALSLEKAIQGISNAKTKEERTKYIRKVIRQTESLIGDTSEMFGVPYENAKKLIEAFTSRVADFKFEDLYTTDSTSEIKQEAYEDGNATYKELYEMYDNGERTKKQITSAIKSTLKEKDTRIAEAAKLRLAGNTDKYMEVAKEIIKDGFKQDDVVTAINGKMNELQKDKKESTTSKKKSLYSTDDVVRALQNGKDAQSVIDEIVKVGKENGTDKKSSIKSAIKKAYQEEYRKADDAGKKKIEEKVSGLKADGEALFGSKSFYEWNMQYSGKDVTADIQAGKLKDAQAKIDDIYNKKYQYTVSNVKTFAEKKKAITSISSSIKSSITSVYKPMYQKGDAKTRMQIIQTLNTLRVGQYQLYNQTDYLRWNKAQ